MTYLILNLKRDHVEAVSTSAVLSEFRDGHVSGSGHDAVVDAPLPGIDSCRETVSFGLECFELAFRGLLLLHQLLSTGPGFRQGLLVCRFLLLGPLLQTSDLVQEAQGLLFLALEGPPDHFQFSIYGRLFPHVSDRTHTFL